MRIGVPREIKDRENRVAMTPAGVRELVELGHTVYVQRSAGAGSGFDDDEFAGAGAELVSAEAAWGADMVVKVKEPMPSEYSYLRDQMVFTYFHLSGVPRSLTEALIDAGTTAVAYETVEDEQGALPLLAPMSAVAGDLAAAMGGYFLARFNGGRGMLLGKVLGQRYGKVLVIGDGVVGRHAAATAAGMGAEVFLCSRHSERAAELAREVSPTLHFVLSSPETIARHVRDSDLVIGAVLVRGARAPYVVTEQMVRTMPPGSVIVDVSIDQGGCIETSRPTSHSEPVYEQHGVIHYCVTNMPGAYPRTSTQALTRATLPYAIRLAEEGLDSLRRDAGFARGVNTFGGHICYRPVAEDLHLETRYREFS